MKRIVEGMKRVSINNFEKGLIKENIATEILEGTDDVEFQVKRTLTLPEMMNFVTNIVDSCVDGEMGEYTPEAYDFAVRVNVLKCYANFAMPENYEKQYMLVYNTTAFDQVMRHINKDQFGDMMRSVDKKIKFMLDILSSSAAAKVSEVIEKFNDIGESFAKAFTNIDAGAMTSLLENAAKMKDMSEEDLAKAILNVKASAVDSTEISSPEVKDE